MNYLRGIIVGSFWIGALSGMDSPLDENHQKLIDTIRIDTSISDCLEPLKKLFIKQPMLSKKIIELDHSGKCALDYAEKHDYKNALEILYNKLSLIQKNELIRRAADRGNLSMAKKSIQKGAQIIHEARIPPFNLAVEKGYQDIIALFYAKEPRIQEHFNYGLVLAAQRGHKDLAIWLLAHGAQPGYIDPDTEKTPLELAIEKSAIPGIGSHFSLLRALLPQWG